MGFLRPASGTWGSGAAVVCCALLEVAGAGKVGCALLAMASFALGVPSAQGYGERTGQADHSDIVIDEFAAMAGVLVFAPAFIVPALFVDASVASLFASLVASPVDFFVAFLKGLGGLWGWAAAFVLFRLCDIVKPFPASYLDRRWKNGWGVMLDDVAAGVWAVGFLWLLEVLLGGGVLGWGLGVGYRFFL